MPPRQELRHLHSSWFASNLRCKNSIHESKKIRSYSTWFMRQNFGKWKGGQWNSCHLWLSISESTVGSSRTLILFWFQGTSPTTFRHDFGLWLAWTVHSNESSLVQSGYQYSQNYGPSGSTVTRMPPHIQQLLHTYAEIFASKVSFPPPRSCSHSIPLLSRSRPVVIKPYRYAPALKDELSIRYKICWMLILFNIAIFHSLHQCC